MTTYKCKACRVAGDTTYFRIIPISIFVSTEDFRYRFDWESDWMHSKFRLGRPGNRSLLRGKSATCWRFLGNTGKILASLRRGRSPQPPFGIVTERNCQIESNRSFGRIRSKYVKRFSSISPASLDGRGYSPSRSIFSGYASSICSSSILSVHSTAYTVHTLLFRSKIECEMTAETKCDESETPLWPESTSRMEMPQQKYQLRTCHRIM